MSDPVIKGAKRSSSRPAPHSAAPKAPAKGRKLTAEAAKPKPKRAAAAKPPVRKAAPAKSSNSNTKSTKTARPSASFSTSFDIGGPGGNNPVAFQPNQLGLRKGYDPYDSGALVKKEWKKKKDLRKLSDWIKSRKPKGE